MKDIFEKLITIADQLDDQGYSRQADMLDAVAKTLLNNFCPVETRRKSKDKPKEDNKDVPDKVKKEVKEISDDAVKARKALVDDKNIDDLFDAKEALTKMKGSEDYSLNDEEWSAVYEQVLEDRFRREYEEKSEEDLEKELNVLLEDKKRKGELNKEEELEFEMIDNIYKRKSNEEVRPSDAH